MTKESKDEATVMKVRGYRTDYGVGNLGRIESVASTSATVQRANE